MRGRKGGNRELRLGEKKKRIRKGGGPRGRRDTKKKMKGKIQLEKREERIRLRENKAKQKREKLRWN